MLRIIAGKYKGRTLNINTSENIRPTLGRLRQTIFDILNHQLSLLNLTMDEMNVLDCFAGSGALGIEAISRGASNTIFIENSTKNVKILEKNLSFIAEQTKIIKKDFFQLKTKDISPNSLDIIFADPPYDMNLANKTLNFLSKNSWLRQSGLIVLETSLKEQITIPNDLRCLKEYVATNSKFIILKLS